MNNYNEINETVTAEPSQDDIFNHAIIDVIANGYNDKPGKSNILKKIKDAELINISDICKSVGKFGVKRSFNDIEKQKDENSSELFNQSISKLSLKSKKIISSENEI